MTPNRLALLLFCSAGGCAQWPGGSVDTAQSTGGVVTASAEEPVIRGQSFEEPTYLAPSEVLADTSCQTSPPVYALPPGYVFPTAPMQPPPPAPLAAQQAQPPQAGWFDMLPPEGGAISPDFGLPREAVVDNRLPNPLLIRAANSDAAWESIADVLTLYFPIQSEQRVQNVGGVLTEGRFETPWQTGATVFEPWRNDSVGPFNRWQSTLQTIRRRATVRVIPAAGGYEVGVRVAKQLEDLPRPERASSGAASLRNDASLPVDRLNPVDRVLLSPRWIDIGRDEPLEQEMLRRFREKLAAG